MQTVCCWALFCSQVPVCWALFASYKVILCLWCSVWDKKHQHGNDQNSQEVMTPWRWMWTCAVPCSKMESSVIKMFPQWDKMIAPCLAQFQFLSQRWCEILTLCQWAITASKSYLQNDWMSVAFSAKHKCPCCFLTEHLFNAISGLLINILQTVRSLRPERWISVSSAVSSTALQAAGR